MPVSADTGIVVYGLPPGTRASAEQPVSTDAGRTGSRGSPGAGDRGLGASAALPVLSFCKAQPQKAARPACDPADQLRLVSAHSLLAPTGSRAVVQCRGDMAARPAGWHRTSTTLPASVKVMCGLPGDPSQSEWRYAAYPCCPHSLRRPPVAGAVQQSQAPVGHLELMGCPSFSTTQKQQRPKPVGALLWSAIRMFTHGL
ncbi:hypothetical protein PSEUDO8AS_40094 [Pseudomonas sp. 8AS]|nr:hypothetical protein PSEUDO8AS_40094 [Pseudomonas sp. 8AS]